MKGCSIHWGQACKGRLQSLPLSKKDVAGQAAPHAGRLRSELAAGTLPFINMPYRAELEAELPSVMAALAAGMGGKCRHMLLLGIGGSALGPRALQKAFAPEHDWPGYEGPQLWIADNVGAVSLAAWMDKLPPEQTLVVVISKSGGTLETMAQFFAVRGWMQKALGANWKKHFLLVTDKKSGALRALAAEEGLASLPVPEHLGGRYSVLSAVGLVPAHFLGLNWQALLSGAHSVTAALAANPDSLGEHPAWRLACWNKALIDNSYNQLIFFSYIPEYACFGDWFAQLWAESLGKSGQGSMPIPAVGVTDQHSLLQMFLDGPADKGCLFLQGGKACDRIRFGQELPEKWAWLRGKSFAELLPAEAVGTLGAFAARKTPLVRLEAGAADENSAGKLIALLELATLFTGWLLGINPLDQPAVESGKRLANARLGAPGYADELRELENYFALPDESQDV